MDSSFVSHPSSQMNVKLNDLKDGVEVFLVNEYDHEYDPTTPDLMAASFTAEDSDDDDMSVSQCTYLSAVDELSHVSSSFHLQQYLDQFQSTTMTVEGIYTRKTKTSPKFVNAADERGNLYKKYHKKHWMRRRRLWTEPMDPSSVLNNNNNNKDGNKKEAPRYSKAMFSKGVGLQGVDFQEKWKKPREERSVLIQSAEHYEQLKHHSTFGQLFDNEDYMKSPTFGEQIIVKGMDSTDICIGDVFQIEGNMSTLVLEVTSPRLPHSSSIDSRLDTGVVVADSTDSLREFTKVHGLAGWFARVLVDGELRDGMSFQRTKHPYPKWTLAYTSKALYGEGNSIEQTFHKPTWNTKNRTIQELYELTKIPQLANHQWKEKAKYLLYQHYYISHKLQTNNSAPGSGMMDSLYNTLFNIDEEDEDSAENINDKQQQQQQESVIVPTYTVPYLPDDNQTITVPSVSMSVKGVYKKSKIPRKDELPYGHTAKDLATDQFMPRRRLRLKKVSSQQEQGDEEEKKYDEAYFLPGKGLLRGGPIFHLDKKQEHTNDNGWIEDRAILWQSTEHYETIKSNPLYKGNFENMEHDYMTKPTFGEQVIISGCNSSQICVGDVFEVQGRTSSLVVEVTAPRKPCHHVDGKHDTPKGLKGMKRYTMTNALAGWLTRVLVPGELCEDMTLVRTRNPNPKWTLTFISKVLFSEGNRIQLGCGIAHWARDDLAELIELINLPQLGHYEWKEDAEELLWKELQKEKESLDEIIESDNYDHQEGCLFEMFSNFLQLGLCT